MKLRRENTDRWKLIEYWFRRENKGNEVHFKLVGLIVTSRRLIPGKELRTAAIVGLVLVGNSFSCPLASLILNFF